VPGVAQRFGSCAFVDEAERASLMEYLWYGFGLRCLSIFVLRVSDIHAFFSLCSTHGYIVDAVRVCLNGCGVKLTRNASQGFARSPMCFAFTTADIRLTVRFFSRDCCCAVANNLT
jgi:hypothetical protein